MVVNSIIFLLFFVVVFIVYYLPLSKSKPFYQNAWLLLVSYFFYGYTDWRMITMLLGSTLLFYILGAWLRSEMDKKHTKKRLTYHKSERYTWCRHLNLFQIPEFLC